MTTPLKHVKALLLAAVLISLSGCGNFDLIPGLEQQNDIMRAMANHNAQVAFEYKATIDFQQACLRVSSQDWQANHCDDLSHRVAQEHEKSQAALQSLYRAEGQ